MPTRRRFLPTLGAALGRSALAALALGTIALADHTPAELELKRQLGADTPDPIALWPGKPPRFVENAPAEVVAEHARIRSVSVPTITPYPPPKEKRTGMAIIVCAGGGYGGSIGRRTWSMPRTSSTRWASP